MPTFLTRAHDAPASNVALEGGALVKADHRTELGPSIIGDPSVPTANTLTTWGQPLRPMIPVRDPGVPLLQYRGGIGALDPLAVWRSQPSVRKVASFIARNVAAVPFKAYVRAADTDRQRVASSGAERGLRYPQRFRSGYQLIRDVVTDGLLYDAWCIAYLKLPGDSTERLYRISPRLLQLVTGPFGTIERVGLRDIRAQGGVIDITDQPLALGTGWSDTGAGGVSPMTTLAAILTEQSNAVDWRNRKWTQSPKVAGLLKRPLEAPRWQPTDREGFLGTWRSWRDGTAEGTPILEDGMSYEQLEGLNPVDAKDIEGRQLTDAEVASAFHIAPELVGARAGTFANVAAFRQMLYGPALGPYMADLGAALNAPEGIVAALDDTADLYVEQDRESAMQGSFAEQASYLQTSIGAPWITPNEGRAKVNMPAIEGGDALVKPLNVTEGGQASPTDSGSQNADPEAEEVPPAPSDGKAFRDGHRLTVKAYGPSKAERDELRDEVADLFRRMATDIDGPIADTKAFHEVWDAAVAGAIGGHLSKAAEASARRVLKQLDAPADAWAVEVMAGYLKAMADTHAGHMVGGVIERANSPWPADPAKPDEGPSHNGLVAGLVVAAALLSRSALQDAHGFGASDAAHASGASSKTWETGPNPRESHAAIDGETVGADEPFSIGLMWPGDSSGDVAEVADCNCGMSFTIED